MNINVGIGWYRKDQYELLLQYSVDRDKLDPSYEAWKKYAEKEMKKMEKRGLAPRKTPVDVLDMVRWCQIQGLVMNGEARAEYITNRTQELYG